MMQKVAIKREFEAELRHATTGKLSLSTQQLMGIFFELRKAKAAEGKGLAPPLWPRYMGTLIPTAPTAIRLRETFAYSTKFIITLPS